jgi:hypothetical protein
MAFRGLRAAFSINKFVSGLEVIWRLPMPFAKAIQAVLLFHSKDLSLLSTEAVMSAPRV